MKTIKTIIKCLLVLLAAIVLILTGAWLINAPKEFAEGSLSLAKLEQGDYTVAELDLEITDSTRQTPELGKFQGDDKRTLAGKIWFPEGESSGLPLVIYSHGFGGNHKESSHLTKYLAANGYVVAAVNFPLSHSRSPAGVPQLLDVVNQPGDVSAVIDHMLALNKGATSPLAGRLDVNKIGAMGLSLGGLTTALATFHPDLRDTRIQAAVMMAPPIEAFSSEFYASNPSVNSLVISGSMDRVVPEPANATDVKPRFPGGWFMSIEKGTHLGFADVGNPLRAMDNPDDLGCALMDYMLARLDLPERWDAVIPNTNDVLRDIEVTPPCPLLPGKAMNGLQQQWLTRIAIGSFFDMQLRADETTEQAATFFTQTLSAENSDIELTPTR